jgi:hypothetical protein
MLGWTGCGLESLLAFGCQRRLEDSTVPRMRLALDQRLALERRQYPFIAWGVVLQGTREIRARCAGLAGEHAQHPYCGGVRRCGRRAVPMAPTIARQAWRRR